MTISETKIRVKVLRLERADKDLIKITHDHDENEIPHFTSKWVYLDSLELNGDKYIGRRYDENDERFEFYV